MIRLNGRLKIGNRNMTIAQLKKSLTRFSPDLDDTEILFVYRVDGIEKFEVLSFVAYSEIPDEAGLVCIFGTMSAAIERMKAGKLKYPDGHRPSTDGIDLSGNTPD